MHLHRCATAGAAAVLAAILALSQNSIAGAFALSRPSHASPLTPKKTFQHGNNNRASSVNSAAAAAIPVSDRRPSSIRAAAATAAPSSSLPMSTAAAVDAGGAQDDTPSGGTASVPNEIFNLIKSIVGAGVLSLPAGVAAFGNAPSAILPASALVAIIGGISAYCFSLIGRVCAYTGAETYRGAWDESVGTSTSWIPAASCTFKTILATLAYSMILADTFQKLLQTGGVALSRSNTLFAVTGVVLLPLCLLKNLASLAPFSLLGIIGMGYTSVAMAIRYLGGAYKEGGKFYADVPEALRPSFGSVGAKGVLHPSSFILVCMLSTAYMAHFNAPKFYTELKDNTIKRYNAVVGTSFAVSIATFIAMTAMGFLTFGSASSGLILNNYSTKDTLMSLSRVAVAVSIVFSYPLVFVGVRDGLLDLAKVPMKSRTNATLNKVTVAVLACITSLALVVKDLSFVLSFGGATLGNALIYVYPALMFRAAVKKMGDRATTGQRREVKFAMGTAALGVAMGAIGARMSIKSLLG